jgi:hypothetical protein
MMVVGAGIGVGLQGIGARRSVAKVGCQMAQFRLRWYGFAHRFFALQMKIFSQCREEARWAYNAAVY